MKKNTLKHNHFFFYCGLLMLISELWKQYCLTYTINNGTYNWWYFPFQLCSVPMYLCLFLSIPAFFRIRGIFLTFLMDFGLLGGIFTFFDTTGMHYSYSPLTVHSFAWHILLIIIGICAGLSKESDYSRKGFLKSSLLFLVCCLIATVFNFAFHPYGEINMFYISPFYPMRQVVFRGIARLTGNASGILIYIISIIIGAGLLHLFWNHLTRYGSHAGQRSI